LHCDLSLSNVLLNRKDDRSEPIGLLIDYDFSIDTNSEAVNQKDTATNASDTHDTLIGGRVVVAPDIEGGVAVGARKVRSETP